MTPKEKAQELINKFYFDTSLTDIDEVKQCAIIAIDEIIIVSHPFGLNDYTDYLKNGDSYWHKVKKEIEKI
jgi:hypothetical protein